jgi:signal transduction histidine kinase
MFLRQAAAITRERHAREALAARVAEQDAQLGEARSSEQRSQSQLVAMGRYWSIGQLTAGISQEIARPLALARAQISGVRSSLPDLRGLQDEAQRLVDLMRSSQTDPRQVDMAVSALANHLQHLRRANAIDALDGLAWGGLRDVEHIAELMAQLRGFFRPDSGSAVSFNLNDAVHAALLITQPLTRGLALEKSLGDVPAIDCRPAEVIQLVLSLVARAAQSVTREGGRVRVATRALSDGVALDVWNEGSTQGEDGDLAIARQIVARHAGGIALRPSGDGTLVAVELPLGALRAAASA